ncbi:MAG TPA: hypothetical protein VLQ80_07150 [Candidatus Saccharimonadia bacterium]|nr:hypothetical protein [Candidatus Saccharimonadia bacterium]
MSLALAEQLACARRWHTYGARLCPVWVAQGRMTEAEMDHELRALAALVTTLETLVASQDRRPPEGPAPPRQGP